jgi:hypothetical protein
MLFFALPLAGAILAIAMSYVSRKKSAKKTDEKREKKAAEDTENGVKKVQWHTKAVAYMATSSGKRFLVSLAFLVGYIGVLAMISQLSPLVWSRWMDASFVFVIAQVLFITAIILRIFVEDKKVRRWPIGIMVFLGLVGLLYVGLGGKRSKEQIKREEKDEAKDRSNGASQMETTILPLPLNSYQSFFPINDREWTAIDIPGCDSCDIRHDHRNKRVLMKDENGTMLNAAPEVKHGDHYILYVRTDDGEGKDIVRLRPYNKVVVQ